MLSTPGRHRGCLCPRTRQGTLGLLGSQPAARHAIGHDPWLLPGRPRKSLRRLQGAATRSREAAPVLGISARTGYVQCGPQVDAQPLSIWRSLEASREEIVLIQRVTGVVWWRVGLSHYQ